MGEQILFYDKDLIRKGSASSGNHGHRGRPGHRGGSTPGSGAIGTGVKPAAVELSTELQHAIDNTNKLQDYMDEYYDKAQVDEFFNKHPGCMSEDEQGNMYDYLIANNGRLGDYHMTVIRKIEAEYSVADRMMQDKEYMSALDQFRNDPDLRKTFADLTRGSIHQWAVTSGDSHRDAIVAQCVAKDVFDLKESETDHFDQALVPRDEAIKHDSFNRAFLKAQYEETQAFLKEKGIDSVVVFRGVEGVHEQYTEGASVTLKTQPMSSFTINPQTASDFASSGNNNNGVPTLITCIVPAKNIIGLPGHGYGCLSEKEVVVLGGVMQSSVVHTNNLTYQARGSTHPLVMLSEMRQVFDAMKKSATTIPNIDRYLADADWPKRTRDDLVLVKSISKFSIGQPRDELGRWANAGGAGRYAYHGTPEGNLAKIKKEGLHAGNGLFRGRGVYASDARAAYEWGVFKWCKDHGKTVDEAGRNDHVAVLQLKKDSFKEVKPGMMISDRDIKPSDIVDVKVFRVRDYEKIMSQKAADDALYLGVLFDATEKSYSVHKGSASSGNHGHRGRPGHVGGSTAGSGGASGSSSGEESNAIGDSKKYSSYKNLPKEARTALEAYTKTKDYGELYLKNFDWRLKDTYEAGNETRYEFEYLPKGGRTVVEPRYEGDKWPREVKYFDAKGDRLTPDGNPEYSYRGMNIGEYEASVARGYIQSTGKYNFTGQEGRTYFGDCRTACSYAGGFAPGHLAGTFERPGVVVGVPKNLTPDQAPHSEELSTKKPIKMSDVKEVIFMRPYKAFPGNLEVSVDTWVGQYKVSEGSRSDWSGAYAYEKQPLPASRVPTPAKAVQQILFYDIESVRKE